MRHRLSSTDYRPRHDDYHIFKDALKDLDVMYTNVINSCFENSASVADGATLVETFNRLAKRDAIHRCVERKAGELQQDFIKSVASCRTEFEENRQDPPLRSVEPQYAGSSLWANSLASMAKTGFEAICRIQHILNERLFEEAKSEYASLAIAVRDFKNHRYDQWIEL